MPVASAAPAMPMAGTGPRPKIRTGSSRMLHTQPNTSATMVTFMRPTAWNIFSKASAAILMVANRNTMVE